MENIEGTYATGTVLQGKPAGGFREGCLEQVLDSDRIYYPVTSSKKIMVNEPEEQMINLVYEI